MGRPKSRAYLIGSPVTAPSGQTLAVELASAAVTTGPVPSATGALYQILRPGQMPTAHLSRCSTVWSFQAPTVCVFAHSCGVELLRGSANPNSNGLTNTHLAPTGPGPARASYGDKPQSSRGRSHHRHSSESVKDEICLAAGRRGKRVLASECAHRR